MTQQHTFLLLLGTWAKVNLASMRSHDIAIIHSCYRLDPFRTPHVRGFFGPRTQERDHLIARLLRLNYAFVHYSHSDPLPNLARWALELPVHLLYGLHALHTQSKLYTQNSSNWPQLRVNYGSASLSVDNGWNCLTTVSTCCKLSNSGAQCKKKCADWNIEIVRT